MVGNYSGTNKLQLRKKSQF